MEQGKVQEFLDELKASDEDKFNRVVENINEGLNGYTFAMFGYVQDAKDEIGGDRKIDFANQKHREALGKSLVKRIRESEE
ncbi:hypothetical protein RCC89_14175 [Cytophagaceae bacterium ABcell3]|nr:hypothetical protein RCC89_14175 [Cytophagaceae bacterium ABcell3]